VPTRKRRFVERHVPVVSDASVAHVGPADLGQHLADLVRTERIGHQVPARGGAQLVVQPAEQLALQEALEGQRMLQAHGPPLPVQPLVHLENPHIAPRDPLAVADLH
jgi:hypothetical protein